MYAADDGTVFSTVQEATEYDWICTEVKALTDTMPETPHGEEFIQLDKSKFLAYQRGLVELWEKIHPRMVDQHTEWARLADEPAGRSLIGRYIDDGGPKPINSAWYRVMCTDHKFRMWEQPFYANRANYQSTGEGK